MADIDVNTSVADVISTRPQLIRLAALVFENTAPAATRAFGQFMKSQDLGRLIQAKRDGVFDYGALILSTDKGQKWPTDVDKILAALDKAEKAELTAQDLVPLFNDEGLAAELFPKVYKKAANATATAKKPVVEKKSVEKKVETKVEEKSSSEIKAAPLPTNGTAAVAEAAKIVAIATPAVESSSLLRELPERLDDLGKGIAVLRDEMHALFSRQDPVRDALNVLLRNQSALDHNIRVLGSYVGATDTEWADLSDFPAIDTAATPLPPEPGEVVAPAKEKPPVSRASKVESAPIEGAPAETRTTPEVTSTPSEEAEITEEYLQTLELSDLRKLAARLGIKNGDNIGYPAVAKKKIRIAVGLPPKD